MSRLPILWGRQTEFHQRASEGDQSRVASGVMILKRYSFETWNGQLIPRPHQVRGGSQPGGGDRGDPLCQRPVAPSASVRRRVAF